MPATMFKEKEALACLLHERSGCELSGIDISDEREN